MDNILDQDIFLSFYGDDFTGSTDVIEALTLNGIPAALFMEAPNPSEVTGFKLKNPLTPGPDTSIKAFGVAGITRTLSPEQMDKHLDPVLEKISMIPADFFHYKICSTFDSSPEVGSIGYATDIADKYFNSDFIPLVVAAPALNRFCVFGNLFARVDGITYRLDRHPTMSRHPVTPMHESDLRLHLAKQTTRKAKLFDLFALEKEESVQDKQLNEILNKNGEYVLFDTYNKKHLWACGRIIVAHRKRNTTQLLVGSSGMENAIAAYLQSEGTITKPVSIKYPGKHEPIIVMAGSCSPTTDQQVKYVTANGFHGIKMDTLKIVSADRRTEEENRVIKEALEHIAKKQSIAIFSASGPDDPVIRQTRELIAERSSFSERAGSLIGESQGKIMKELLTRSGVRRVSVAGGDTSGFITSSLGIHALEISVPIAPGSPLCIAHSRNQELDGLEIALKGGQNGNVKYFEYIVNGRAE